MQAAPLTKVEIPMLEQPACRIGRANLAASSFRFFLETFDLCQDIEFWKRHAISFLYIRQMSFTIYLVWPAL